MPNFWVGDRIKAKLWAALIFHMLASREVVNATRYVTWIGTTSRRGKVLIFKPKAPSFLTTKFSSIKLLPQKIE